MSDAASWPFVVALGYVGLTIGALGWIVLKHVTADWRVRRRHRTIPEGDIEFDLGEGAAASVPVMNIVLVHGVWALRGDWHRRDSEFLQQLEGQLKKHCAGFRVRVRRFIWTGGNTLTDRNRAAGRYQREIGAFNAQPGVVATFVVAHSHSPTPVTLDEQIPVRLRDHVQRLRLIVPVLSVSCLALKRQAAELDDDTTAAVLLPGMRHARSLLDVSIQVLDYFQKQAAKDAAAGKGVAMEGVEEHLIKEAENAKALLNAFGRLTGRKN